METKILKLLELVKNLKPVKSFNEEKQVYFINFEYFSNEYEIQCNFKTNTFDLSLINGYSEDFRGELKREVTTLKYKCDFKIIKKLVEMLIKD